MTMIPVLALWFTTPEFLESVTVGDVAAGAAGLGGAWLALSKKSPLKPGLKSLIQFAAKLLGVGGKSGETQPGEKNPRLAWLRELRSMFSESGDILGNLTGKGLVESVDITVNCRDSEPIKLHLDLGKLKQKQAQGTT